MYYILLTLYLTSQVNSYVLLQVRKDDQNRSNVDALIHKVVPSGRFDKIAQKIARKQFSTQKAESENEPATLEVSSMEKNDEDKDQEVFEKKPVFRSKDLGIKPQVIHFRSGQPSLMYDVSSNVIIRALKDFLSSKLVSKYTDDVAKKAAAVFRSLSKDSN